MISIIYGKHYEATTTLNQFANFVFAIRNVMFPNPSIRGSVHFTFTVNIFMGVIICAKVQIKQQGRCHTVHPSSQPGAGHGDTDTWSYVQYSWKRRSAKFSQWPEKAPTRAFSVFKAPTSN